MRKILESRRNLHKNLSSLKQENDNLKKENDQLQSLANLGSSAYMIAHEINNLISPIINYSELALQNIDEKKTVKKALEKAVYNSKRISEIMYSMLALGNNQKQDKKKVVLKELVAEVFTCLSRDFSRDGITVNLQVPGDINLFCVPVQIQQVLMNLILNARDSMLGIGGILAINASSFNDSVLIEVVDTGKGIAKEYIERIFDSFFSTKNVKQTTGAISGSGVGLAFCKRVIESHGGSICVESVPKQGSRFSISLPNSGSG